MELVASVLTLELPKKLGVDVTEGENTREVDCVTGGIVSTLEEALKRSKTDLSVWRVHDHIINFWAVPMKLKNADGQDEPVKVQVCQVKAWLVRKQLRAVMPMIRPVQIQFKQERLRKTTKGGINRSLIIADPQIGFRRNLYTNELVPFHDRRVLDLAVQISMSEHFDALEVIGDVHDMSEFSTKFTPEPEFYWMTQPALLEWAWWLQKFGHIRKKRQLEGNHEKRMGDYVKSYAKAAYGLRAVDELELPPSLSYERLMAFHSLGVDYIKGYPDNFYWLNRNVLIRHGDLVRAGPGDSAKAIINRTTYTTIFGHVHRREMVTRRIKTRDGDVVQTAFCPGTASHIDGRVPGAKSDDQHQQGLAVVEYTEDFESIIPIPVEEGRAIYKGQIFKSAISDDEVNTLLMKMMGNDK